LEGRLSLKALHLVAIVFAVTAVGIWGVFLRPVPSRAGYGTITKKTFKPAGTYWQYPVGLNRGFQLATAIPISAAYVFEFKMDEFEGPVFYVLSTNASKAFNVGQKIRIHYKQRVIPFVMRRLYVLEMTPA
jgi:hypothetical protein